MNIVWPALELTEGEKRYVDHYAHEGTPDEEGKPGVMRRVYVVQLMRSTFAGEFDVLSQNVGFSGRRIKVFAMMVTGDLFYWSIKLTLLSGETLFTDFTPVPALFNLPAAVGAAFPPDASIAAGSLPLLTRLATPEPHPFEPHIVIEGTQEIIVEGRCGPGIVNPDKTQERSVLNVAFHVWEYPDIPRDLPPPGTPLERQSRMRSDRKI